MERSLRVLDGAVTLLDSVAGVEPQTETVWRQADRYGVPRLIFANKMDRVGADFDRCVAMIRDRLTKKAYPIQLPVGSGELFTGHIDVIAPGRGTSSTTRRSARRSPRCRCPRRTTMRVEAARHEVIEAAVEHDDELMEKYLAGEELTFDEIQRAIRKATISGSIVPVLCGASFKNKGVQALLDAVIDYLPAPIDIPPIKGHLPHHDDTHVERCASDDEPFAALAFKIATDPYVGRLTFFRVYSGVAQERAATSTTAPRTSGSAIGRLLQMHANKREEIEEVLAGDIAAAIGLKDTRTGDTLCDEDKPIILEAMKFPNPVIDVAIEPKTKADQDKLAIALQKLQEEDPTFRVRSDAETGQTIIAGMGELHLEIIVDRMKREFKVEANVGRPQVAYPRDDPQEGRRTSRASSSGSRAARASTATSSSTMEPAEPGGGFVFEDKIVGGVIPREFIKPVEAGIREALENGVLAGYPMVDVKVELIYGSTTTSTAREMAFKIAGSMAVKEAAAPASAVLLEPIMEVEVVSPSDFLGDVIGDLSARRGKIGGMTQRGEAQVVAADVPLAEMFGYSTKLRSMTQGRAVYSMEFAHYEEVPKNNAERSSARRRDRR